MSYQTTKHVHYREESWSNVVDTYGLDSSIEITMRNDTSQSKAKSSSFWGFRALSFIGLAIIIGNIPVQSTSTSKDIQSFAITPRSILATDSTLPTNDSSQPKISLNDKNSGQRLETDHILFSSLDLSLPKRALETYGGHVENVVSGKWKTYIVKSYDNLTNIFHKLGIQPSLKVLQENKTFKKELALLKEGSIVRASSSTDGKLSELIFTHNKKDSYIITLNNDKYTGTWAKNVFEIRQSRASFTIKNGLFFDGRRAGVANHIIRQIVKVFDWDIDFSHDIRVGDKVTAVFEEIYHEGDKVGNQHLLAAEFLNKGREFKAIRYTYKDGKSDYFTPQGREMKKAFIRTPISHARISSHFNPGRFHPVLHNIRAHKGTDFAARTGTPIMATGNGTIKSLGRKGGYGRTIVIKHREGYTTLYAHMSKYKSNLKVGDKVYQGDIIGYVGSSGLATGPHLHYEFRLNNKPIDPMKAPLPRSMALNADELQNFRDNAINLVLQLNVLHRFVNAEIEINNGYGG